MIVSFRFPRIVGALAGLAGSVMGLGGPAAAQPQSVTPSEAPAEWVRYAEAATQSITGWLEGEDEAAIRFRAYLHQTRPAEDQPTPPLVLKVWIAAHGLIERIDFPLFAHETANADLRAAIVGRSLVSSPPRGMLQPLRVGIQLEPAAPVAGTVERQPGDVRGAADKRT